LYSVGKDARVPWSELALAANAVGSSRQGERRMLFMRHPCVRRVNLDMPDIEAWRYVPRESVVAKHGYALVPYRMAVAAFLAFRQYDWRAFGIFLYRSRWRDIRDALDQQITLREDLGHHDTSLRSSTHQGLGAYIPPYFFPGV
jgi:hypothetical protein